MQLKGYIFLCLIVASLMLAAEAGWKNFVKGRSSGRDCEEYDDDQFGCKRCCGEMGMVMDSSTFNFSRGCHCKKNPYSSSNFYNEDSDDDD